MGPAVALGFVLGVMAAIAIYLTSGIVRSYFDEKNKNNGRLPVWRNFGLSIAFAILFFVSWGAHGVAEWQQYTDHQREHGQQVEGGDFAAEFAAATLENWQSEFLQLFSFVVLSALLLHKGSAESKDSSERVESAVHRIEQHLGLDPVTENPLDAPPANGRQRSKAKSGERGRKQRSSSR